MTVSGTGMTTLSLRGAGLTTGSVAVADVTVQGAEEAAVEEHGEGNDGDGDNGRAAGEGLRSSSMTCSNILANTEYSPSGASPSLKSVLP